MDLIYANDKREDLGALLEYDIDIAYGADENNFELTINKENHCCEEGFLIYAEGTEYGGIIDKIKVSTSDENVVYKGRTWHGILEGKVICPESGQDYLILDGDANAVLSYLIELLDVGDIFEASKEESGISIYSYQMDRYICGYTGINKMLQKFGGKLKMSYESGKVVLHAQQFIDYSQDDEFDQSQVDFQIEKNYRPVNHLICLGSGDLKERAVIHLFTDENGAVQPYTLSEMPLQDSDYILDSSQQVIFGTDEVCQTYDYPNSETKENFVILTEEPADFATNFEKYYQIVNGEFKEIETGTEDTFSMQTTKPTDWDVYFKNYYVYQDGKYISVADLESYIYSMQSEKPFDWDVNYSKYFVKNGSEYASVNAVTRDVYTPLSEKPVDWWYNYKNYYYKTYNDEWVNVPPFYKYDYYALTSKPADWESKYNTYYIKSGTKYVHVEAVEGKAPEWKKSIYYYYSSSAWAPTFFPNAFFSKSVVVSAPQWTTGTYYTKEFQSIPEWTAGTYYTKVSFKNVPVFISGIYYKKVFDRLANMIEGGIKILSESYNADQIDIDIDSENEYDIGDIVGAYERVTGIAVWQPITKKIVNLKNNEIVSINYKIGV